MKRKNIYRKAAKIADTEECCGCPAIAKVVYGNYWGTGHIKEVKFPEFFLFKPPGGDTYTGGWWKGTHKEAQEPRVLALLFAAQMCDESKRKNTNRSKR